MYNQSEDTKKNKRVLIIDFSSSEVSLVNIYINIETVLCVFFSRFEEPTLGFLNDF